MKRYINYSIVYAVLAMIGGVFYREFTKMNDYAAWTTLSVVHTHYFILGMMFFLILGLVSMNTQNDMTNTCNTRNKSRYNIQI